MALTIAIEGKGVIADAEDITSDTPGGSWYENGAGTVTNEPDIFLQGTQAVSGKYSNKSGETGFDIGSGNELDFTPSTGAEAGQFIYIWINVTTPGAINTLANKGYAIRLSSTLNTDYREYKVLGSDDTNGYTGGWKCFVIDPTKAGSVSDTGTFDISSVRYIAAWMDTNTLVKAENNVIDQIAVGKGLRITGTSTTPWQDIVDYCTDFTNRAWGMVQEREGIIYVYGKIWIGDSTQTAVTSFQETSGKVIKFGATEYYNISDVWAISHPVDYAGIVVEDAASYATTFDDGVIVGTDAGRSGSTYIGDPLIDVSIDLYGGNNSGSLTRLYGTNFRQLTGTINMGNDAQHLFDGGVIDQCGQFDPVGAPILRNLIITGTADTDAALLWNENINIIGCNFIANTLGAAIEMPSAAGTPYAYNALSFSGNTDDVLNSSGSAITINLNNGSDASEYEGSAVTFVNTKTFKFTLSPSITGYEWRIYSVTALGSLAGASELDGEENAIADNQTYQYNYSSDQAIAVQIIPQPNEDYVESITYYTLTIDNKDLTIILTEDINN